MTFLEINRYPVRIIRSVSDKKIWKHGSCNVHVKCPVTLLF